MSHVASSLMNMADEVTGPKWSSDNKGALVARSRLFLTSYCPLFVIFAVKSEEWPAFCFWSAVAVIGGILGYRLIVPGKRQSRPIRFDAVIPKTNEVSGYLATYLLPFVTAAPSAARDYAAFAIYLTVAFVIFVRSNLALVNPLLYFFGYHVVEAQHGNKQVIVVCRSELPVGETVEVFGIMGNVGFLYQTTGGGHAGVT